MGWHARTGNGSVHVGTILSVYWNGQITGQPERQLTGRVSIDIETSQEWSTAEAESTGPGIAILIMPDGVRFQMTFAREDERALGISMGRRMVSRDWIVRSQIVTTHGPER